MKIWLEQKSWLNPGKLQSFVIVSRVSATYLGLFVKIFTLWNACSIRFNDKIKQLLAKTGCCGICLIDLDLVDVYMCLFSCLCFTLLKRTLSR